MLIVPGLRSCYGKVGRVYYFGRMLDKIRLHVAGQLPPADYAANLGKGFDGRTCSFLRLNYDELKAKTLAGGLTDEQLLAWAEEKGGRRSDEECEVWNSFMMTRGWRDDVVPLLTKRIQESGLGDRTILTMFDYIDFDEGRDPVGSPPWAPKS